MNRLIILLLVIATFTPLASAAIITQPTDLNWGDTYRLAFVTSTERDARSPNIADYHAFVTGVANSVPELLALGTTWRAIASTPGDPSARNNTGTNGTGVPIYRLDDLRIANDNADLWDGAIANSLGITESGTPRTTFVWTGTDAVSGGGFTHALSTPSPILGESDKTDGLWVTRGFSARNTTPRAVYAISGDLTVPIPEPSALFLVGFGATAVVGWQLGRRRQRKRQ